MISKEPDYSIGIEEEYYLVDLESRNLIQTVPSGMWPKLEKALGDHVTREFLQCQVEIGTPVCKTISQARTELGHFRANVAQIASEFDLGLIASSTHPFALSGQQQLTDKDRYYNLAKDLQQVVRRLLISGMHIHVGLPDDDLRIDLMSQAAYILPHLLALSTSSPFWRGQDTGLKSYRICVWNEMPRTGLPAYFDTYTEYKRHVEVLVSAGIIQDSSKIWWDIRPSHKFPTLEIRIADICTDVDDAVCIAAIYACWIRMLYRLRRSNQRWRTYANFLIQENRWRAHRYGIDEGLIDFGIGEIKPHGVLIAEILDIISEDAQALNCVKEVNHAKTILERGTSAHNQLNIYNDSINNGKSADHALKDVVDGLIKKTTNNCVTKS